MSIDARHSIVRFGEFEFDPAAGDLRRRGQRIQIQEQPLTILEMLVARAGELVTRQDLCERLWPEAFVDFDNGLNNAVSRLRTALDDSATSPRFIETLGRRGYRFMATVEPARGAAAGSPVGAWLSGEVGRVALAPGENILGRHAPGVLELPSSTVSRRHARIMIGDETWIEDLESKNGTFVDERKVTRRVPLDDGAQVRIGSLILRFTIVSGTDETRTAGEE
jgi:DNA-binding winged helix-turn-helix (wHTH) protein